MKRLALRVPVMGLLAAAVLWTLSSSTATAGPPSEKLKVTPPGSIQATIPKMVPLPPGAIQKMPPAGKPGKPGQPAPSAEDWGKFWGGVLGGMGAAASQYPPSGYYPPAGAYPPSGYYPPSDYPPSGYPSTAVPSNVLPSTSAYPPAQAGPLVLINETGFAINYVLAGTSYGLTTGNAHKYQLAQAAIIEFDRGGSFGMAQYTLAPGQYEFSVTDKGWELQIHTPPPPQVLLVNKTALAVNYRLNGTPYRLTPGNSQQLPAVQAGTIEFDRGGSFGGARYSLTPGDYEFSVTDKGWDIHSQRSSQ